VAEWGLVVLGCITLWAIWDAGRPGHASRGALAALRAVGGLALLALAAPSADSAPWAAAVAAAVAAGLLAGLFHRPRRAGSSLRHRLGRPAPAVPANAADSAAGPPPESAGRRAA
jgi:hypothetical protein